MPLFTCLVPCWVRQFWKSKTVCVFICVSDFTYITQKLVKKNPTLVLGNEFFLAEVPWIVLFLADWLDLNHACSVREVYHMWWLLSSSTPVIHPISLRHIPQYSWGWDAQGVYGIFWWVEEKEVLGLVHRQGMTDNVTSGTHLHFGRLAAGWELGSRSPSLCSQNCIFSCHV